MIGGVAVVLGGFLFEDLGLGSGGKEKLKAYLKCFLNFYRQFRSTDLWLVECIFLVSLQL